MCRIEFPFIAWPLSSLAFDCGDAKGSRLDAGRLRLDAGGLWLGGVIRVPTTDVVMILPDIGVLILPDVLIGVVGGVSKVVLSDEEVDELGGLMRVPVTTIDALFFEGLLLVVTWF